MRLLRSAHLFLLALLVAVTMTPPSHAAVFISVGFAPPILPVYVQPICPEPDLMWTPGYWAYGGDGYYWVPGAWVPAPYMGALWTPGYWGWGNNLFLWHEGYWGAHIGYYGGVNYGFGYMGIGFAGGEWRGGHFAYNTAVMRVNTTIIHTTYVNETIVHNTTIVNTNHVAYNGGPGGIQHQPTTEESAAMHETHVPPTHFQQAHVQTAAADKTSYAKVNGGKPHTLAVAKPLAMESHPAPAPRAMTPAAHTTATPGSREPEHTPAAASAPARSAPAYHPAPEARTPPPPSRPAPESHPAPRPESHPAPKPEPKKEPKGR
jgi:hypothetical protein